MIKKVIIAIVIALALSVALLYKKSKDLKSEVTLLSGNQSALLGQIKFYRFQDSLKAASVDLLKLTVKGLKQRNRGLVQTVEGLNIKLKRVRSVSQTATESNYNVNAQVRDSIIYRDSLRVDTVRCIRYDSPWLTLNGCLLSREKFTGKVQTRDTIDQVVHRVPKKFWIFRYGIKAIRQEVVSRNPNSKITFTEYIEVVK